jgi:hypothetical protein
MKSWIGKYVRIKDEYIVKTVEEDVDASTYDDDGNVIDLVTVEDVYLDCPMKNILEPYTVYIVQQDAYGVDLYNYQNTELDTSPYATKHKHLLIVTTPLASDGLRHSYMWDAKYFEVIEKIDERWFKETTIKQPVIIHK